MTIGEKIRKHRKELGLNQTELGERLGVQKNAVSKWETGQGFPDISLLEPLAGALGISVIELLNGEEIQNRNRSSNLKRGKLYVCPVCGNVVQSIGEAVISCCGITLPPLEPEEAEGEHSIHVAVMEDEYYVTVDHPMEKNHYISFLAAVSDQRIQLVKLYPEGNAEARFQMNRVSALYAYCNRHGLFLWKLLRKKPCPGSQG